MLYLFADKRYLDMGVLRVDVISAKGLMAADRSGKSDVSRQAYRNQELILYKPFVVFTLNGARVFKSETKKKYVDDIREWG